MNIELVRELEAAISRLRYRREGIKSALRATPRWRVYRRWRLQRRLARTVTDLKGALSLVGDPEARREVNV